MCLGETECKSESHVLLIVDCSAIVNDQLSALELGITRDMGHNGWANDVTLSNIHERSLFTSRFHLYKNIKEHHKNAFEPHFKIRIIVL